MIKRPLFWEKLAHWQHIVIVIALAFPIMSGILVLNHKINVAKGDQQSVAVDLASLEPSPTPTIVLSPTVEPTSTLEASPSPQPTPTTTPTAKKTTAITPADTSSTEPAPSGSEAPAPAATETPAPTKKTYPQVTTSLWGISMNPFPNYIENQPVLDTTIGQLANLRVNIVRLDYPLNRSDLQDWYTIAVNQIRARGMSIVISFQPIGTYDTANPWQDGFDAGKKIAQQFGGQVTYQLGNEICGNAIKPGWPGNNEDSFYLDKMNNVRSWVKGASTAVAQYAPGASQATTGHWLHYWCMNEILNGDGGISNIKILGWDWFNDSNQDLTKVKSGDETINLVEKLQQTANGRELWMMESGNQRGGNAGEQFQADYLERLATHIRSTKAFKAFFYFYLHDDANKIDTDPDDGSRGLIRIEKTDDGYWQIGGLKPAYDRYQEIIARYK